MRHKFIKLRFIGLSNRVFITKNDFRIVKRKSLIISTYLRQFFSPLTGRCVINLLKSANISALVGKVQALSDLRNRNSEVGKKRDRIVAFSFVNIFHQCLVCVALELTTQIALIITRRIYDLLYAFGHKVLAVEIDDKLGKPRRI